MLLRNKKSSCTDKTISYLGKSRLIYFLLFLLIMQMACVGSYKSVQLAETSRAFAGQLYNEQHLPPPPPPPPWSKEQIIYIDNTKSMSGFAERNTNFVKLIDTTIRTCQNPKTFWYGLKGKDLSDKLTIADITELVEPDKEIYNSNNYQRNFNPDQVLFREIVKNNTSQKSSSFTVLVTDGVESSPKGLIKMQEITDAIVDWTLQGNIFAILAFKSTFIGPLYSEDLDGKAIIGTSFVERPLYLFIFSSSQEEYNNFIGKLSKDISVLQTVVLNGESITWRPQASISKANIYAEEENKFYSWHILLNRISLNESSYNLKLKIATDYPIQPFNYSLQFQQYKLNESQNKYEKLATQPLLLNATKCNFSDDVSNAVGDDISCFSISPIVESAKNNFNFYSLEDIVIHNTDVTEGIKNLSVPNDKTWETADRTYKFKDFISQLVDKHLHKQILIKNRPYIYLTLPNQVSEIITSSNNERIDTWLFWRSIYVPVAAFFIGIIITGIADKLPGDPIGFIYSRDSMKNRQQSNRLKAARIFFFITSLVVLVITLLSLILEYLIHHSNLSFIIVFSSFGFSLIGSFTFLIAVGLMSLIFLRK